MLEFAEAEIRSAPSLKGRISSSGPNFVFRAAFRLRGRISSSGPNFVFAAEFRLQGRISRLQRSIPEPRTLSNSVFGPNFVFRTNFVFTNEFRLQHAPNRISSSQEFRLHGRFSSLHFVYAHSLSFSSLRTISSSRASEFRLQGGDETGTHFPGSMHLCKPAQSKTAIQVARPPAMSGRGTPIQGPNRMVSGMPKRLKGL